MNVDTAVARMAVQQVREGRMTIWGKGQAEPYLLALDAAIDDRDKTIRQLQQQLVTAQATIVALQANQAPVGGEK